LLAKKYIDYLAIQCPGAAHDPRRHAGGFRLPGLYWVDPRENMWDLVMRPAAPCARTALKKSAGSGTPGLYRKIFRTQFQSGQSLYAVGFKSGDQLTVTGRPKLKFRRF